MDGSKLLRKVQEELKKKLGIIELKKSMLIFPLERKVHCGLSNVNALNTVQGILGLRAS